MVQQAILRRNYTDYMYIVTKPVIDINPTLLFLMIYYGIGWYIWVGKPYMLLKARYRIGRTIDALIEHLIDKKMEEVILDRVDKLVQQKLGV